MRKYFSLPLKLVFSLLFTLILIEAGLHLLPEVIPLNLLVYFDGAPRGEIAKERGLLVRSEDTVKLNRDDGGPPLRVLKPLTEYTWPVKAQNKTITLKMDRNGFCNTPAMAAERDVDIVTLGDSFTFCHAIHPTETWSTQLGQMSGQSVYNLGRVGIGVQEYLQLLKQFGLKKSPEVVIMNIYAGNDLRDADRFVAYDPAPTQQSSAADSEPDDEEISNLLPTDWDQLEEILETYSYSYNLYFALYRFGQNTYGLFGDRATPKRNFRYQLVFEDGTVRPFNPLNVDNDEAKYARMLKEKRLDIRVEQALKQSLREFATLAEEHNFVPVVTLMPSAHTTYQQQAQFEDAKLNQLMPWFHKEQQDFLQEASQTLGLTFLDLTNEMQTAAATYGSESLLYYPTDLHLTPTGHQIVASGLEDALRSEGLLPLQKPNE